MYQFQPKRKPDFSGVGEAVVKFVVFILMLAIVFVASGGGEVFK